MSKLLKLAFVGALTFAPMSIASAQDAKAPAQHAMASQANASVPSGPYVYVPPKKAEPQQQNVRPFTWEEKRFFEMSIGENG